MWRLGVSAFSLAGRRQIENGIRETGNGSGRRKGNREHGTRNRAEEERREKRERRELANGAEKRLTPSRVIRFESRNIG